MIRSEMNEFVDEVTYEAGKFLNLRANLLDFIRILSIEEVDFLAKMTFNVTTNVHGTLRINQINGNAILAKTTSATLKN